MQNALLQWQITQREERLREKKLNSPKSNFIRDCHKESFHGEKNDQIKLFCVFLCRMTFSKGRLNREKKEYEKKILNVPNQISLVSTSRKASTEGRRTKKNFLCFYAECPSPMVDYTERRKKN